MVGGHHGGQRRAPGWRRHDAGQRIKGTYAEAVARRAEPGKQHGVDAPGWNHKVWMTASAAATVLLWKGWDRG